MDWQGGTRAERVIAERPGLQAERTDLSWTRSGLAFLVNGGLLLVRHDLPESTVFDVVAVSMAFLLAVFTLAMARRRKSVLARRPLPDNLAAPVPLMLLASGTVLLGLIVLMVILVP